MNFVIYLILFFTSLYLSFAVSGFFESISHCIGPTCTIGLGLGFFIVLPFVFAFTVLVYKLIKLVYEIIQTKNAKERKKKINYLLKIGGIFLVLVLFIFFLYKFLFF